MTDTGLAGNRLSLSVAQRPVNGQGGLNWAILDALTLSVWMSSDGAGIMPEPASI